MLPWQLERSKIRLGEESAKKWLLWSFFPFMYTLPGGFWTFWAPKNDYPENWLNILILGHLGQQ